MTILPKDVRMLENKRQLSALKARKARDVLSSKSASAWLCRLARLVDENGDQLGFHLIIYSPPHLTHSFIQLLMVQGEQ